MTRTIFDIADDMQAIDDLLNEVGGDVTDEQAEEAIDKWLAELGNERDRKLDGYAHLIKSFSSTADSIKDEIDRLRARKQAHENSVARLKQRLQVYFEREGIEKVKTDLHTFAIQKNGGKPKVVLSDYFAEHPVELPEQLRRVKFEPDLEALRDALETDPEEFKVYGQIAEPGKSLRIR